MSTHRAHAHVAAVSILALGLVAGLAAAQTAPAPGPLPLEEAMTTRAHNGRSSFELSPDGQWVAHNWTTDESLPDGNMYTPSGIAFAEGGNVKRATLTHTKTGETIDLGGPKSSSWAPVWSPDGRRVAFYSDEGGAAGLWIWDAATRKAARVPGVIVRSFFGFEIVRWSPDGQRLLCKILPDGMTVEQANALLPKRAAKDRFPPAADGTAEVFVRSSHKKKDEPSKPDATPAVASTDFLRRDMADLAIIDVRTLRVASRLAKDAIALWYAFSPDGRHVAYTHETGFEPNTQQPIFNILVVDPSTGASKTLAERVRLGYGIELNWSPDSTRLAYIEAGQRGSGDIVLLPIDGSASKRLHTEGVPSFSKGEGEWPPFWDAGGQKLYALGADDKLWQVDATTGAGVAVGDIPGHRITGIVSRQSRSTLWTTESGKAAWVVARDREQPRAGLYRIDLAGGPARAGFEERKSMSNVFNLDGSDATGEIAYVAKDQQHLPDVWIFDPASGRSRQVSHLNAAFERFALGEVRVIEWRGMEGQRLKGALLLPPGYKGDRKLPLVVWIYGGSNGSEYTNSFGFWGDYPTFDFHLLATRGYAVLFPDAPLRDGMPMADLMNTVMPGVNAAIDQGYADPDRLAVMGQSYGSYCSLALISQTTRFKAAVITAAVLHPDLVAGYLTGTGYYEHGQGNMHGTPWSHRDRYLENSPIYLFDRIETPLLIGQGDEDGDLVAPDATFTALERLGKEVEYRLYHREGHVISRRANVLDFWKRRFAFLADHLDLTLDDRGAIVFDGDRAQSRGARTTTSAEKR